MIDETLDIVDQDDQVIGQAKRSVIYANGQTNFRVVNAFVVNSKGELWIPRRTANKRIFPLCLDVSVGGHVETGESYDDTFRREAAEELNINIDQADWKLLGHLTPHQDGVSAFMNVYQINSDQTPDYNPQDFTEYFWLTPAAFFEKLNQETSVSAKSTKDDLPKLIKKFYLDKAYV